MKKFKDYDVLVIGAGIIGVLSALNLQSHNRSVILVDRKSPGEETSYGNAGIIQRETIARYAFPRNILELASYGLNRSSDARVHLRSLPWVAPTLYRYWRRSEPRVFKNSIRALWALTENCIVEHDELMLSAGASHLVRRTGYLRLFRQPQVLHRALQSEEQALSDFGVRFDRLEPEKLAELEPHVIGDYAGAILSPDIISVSDPGALVRAYADLFERRGGHFLQTDATSILESSGSWQLENYENILRANDVVISAGPWSARLLNRLGVRVPLGIKRGYHMHYEKRLSRTLNRPVVDVEYGYVLSEMERGIRLTTGAEFAMLDAPSSPVQLAKVEPVARRILPLGKQIENEPWLGARPFLPDLLPLIGKVPSRKGLWLNFGHHHLGLTLGATSARLLTEMMTNSDTSIDPYPYRLERFQ